MKFLIFAMLTSFSCSVFAGLVPVLKCVSYAPDQKRTELVIQEVFSHFFPIPEFKYRFRNSTTEFQGGLTRTYLGEYLTMNFEGENVRVTFLFGVDIHFVHGPSSTGFVFRKEECLFGRPHLGIEGEYRVHLKTGKENFEDRLFFKIHEGENVVGAPGAAMAGYFTVPGVFTQPLNGRVHCPAFEIVCSISFQFTAVENGSRFRVFFEGEIGKRDKMIRGTAKLEDGSVFGTFTAEQEPYP